MKNSPTYKHYLIAIVMACFGIVAQASAQQPQSGQISGHVIDVVGATIRDASVFVFRRDTPPEQTIKLLTHTDIRGDFKLVLPEGGYDVLVTSPAFAANVQTISVLAGKTSKVQWKLRVLGCNFPGMKCDTVQ